MGIDVKLSLLVDCLPCGNIVYFIKKSTFVRILILRAEDDSHKLLCTEVGITLSFLDLHVLHPEFVA